METSAVTNIEARRRTIAVNVAAYLATRPYTWTADDLAALDDAGWAVIETALNRTRRFSPATRAVIVAYVAGVEAAKAAAPADPFDGLVPA